MLSEERQKKIMEKLNRAQKCSILGPQNLGSGGARAPGAPPGSAPVTATQLLGYLVFNATWKCTEGTDRYCFCWLVRSQLIRLSDALRQKVKNLGIMLMRGCDVISPSNDPADDVNIMPPLFMKITYHTHEKDIRNNCIHHNRLLSGIVNQNIKEQRNGLKIGKIEEMCNQYNKNDIQSRNGV